MRPRSTAVVGLVLLTLLVPSGLPGASGHSAGAPLAGTARTGAIGSPHLVATTPPLSRPTWAMNTTLGPGLLPRGATSSNPISALNAVPLPPLPPTRPTVMTFLNASTSCCFSANVTAPVGTWGLVLLNYTGQAVAGVYDSSFRAYIDQAQVFFGTTPEYGIWYDTVDVTPYVSLLTGTFNFTFLLGAAVTNGYFLTSVSLWFYPTATGVPAPREPNVVIPIWHRVFTSTTSPIVWDTATVPQNVTNATLQLWVYGFGPDEFWYASEPGLREVQVSVNGSGILQFLPFPYINTGGNDLFAWRPITGAFTLSDRPYNLDVSGLLATLEGTHNLTATVSGETTGSTWLVGGSLLLYTSNRAAPASAAASSFSPGSAHIVPGSTSYDEFLNSSYSASSTFGGGTSATTVTEYANMSYADALLTPKNWENLSAAERFVQTVITTNATSRSVSVRTWWFPLSIDLGSVFVPNSGQGTGYPIYGNVTQYMLNLNQEWNETSSTTLTSGATAQATVAEGVDYHVTGGSNLFIGAEKLISANAAQLLSINFVESSTQASYRASTASGGLVWNYQHLLVGSAYNPPAPNEVESVLIDQAFSPVNAILTTSTPQLDVGESVVLTTRAVGGAGAYSYQYWNLPTGCSSASEAALACRPSAAGTFVVWVVATDSAGAASGATSVGLAVVPRPAVTVVGNNSQLDVSVPGKFSTQIMGGVGPYTCTWSLPGNPLTTASCSASFNGTGTIAGTFLSGTVVVVDATGANVTVPFRVDLVPAPVTTWLGTLPRDVAAPGSLALRASTTGGVAPFTYVFLVNNTVVQNSTDANFTLAVTGAGTYTVLVEVHDADGVQDVLGPIAVNGTAPTSPGHPNGSSSSNAASSSDLLLWALLTGVAAGAVGLLVGIVIGRGGRARPPVA